MTLLFAVDLSESREVIAQVEALAERMDATLMILHVSPVAETSVTTDDFMDEFGTYTAYDPTIAKALEDAWDERFRRFVRERVQRPVQLTLHESGDPAACILADAEAYNVDMVVMGRRHHPLLERLLVGSTVRRVVEHITRPVLLIPIPDTQEDD